MKRSATALAIALAAGLATAAPAPARSAVTPVVFVHGQAGSAQQWQSQAKRLSVNGYPASRLFAFEYDTTVPANDEAVAELTAFLGRVRSRTGARQVDVVAHSRGTAVLHAFLADSTRAAGVRRYVNVDGRSSATLPGGVPTLALWSALQPSGSIGGATNVHLGQLAHTESATSAVSFPHLHRFLTGRAPATSLILPEAAVSVAGRAVLFPQNDGVPGLLQVWRVNPATGARLARAHQVPVPADGSFGPLPVSPAAHYEFALLRSGHSTTHHYFEPFERDDHFLRLTVSSPGGIGDQVDRCPGHAAVTITRNRELQAGLDRMDVAGTDLMTEALSPARRQILAVLTFDADCDTRTDLSTPPPGFTAIPFLTGADLHLPSGTNPITVKQTPRGGDGASRTLTVPALPSDTHAITVQFKDYLDLRPRTAPAWRARG
jgi:pimeloyl-ACP methyl ester carboxylesterase